MSEDRRNEAGDRRAHPRNGRRRGDAKHKPWYMRRRLWLATASLVYMGWRRVRSIGRRDRYDIAA